MVANFLDSHNIHNLWTTSSLLSSYLGLTPSSETPWKYSRNPDVSNLEYWCPAAVNGSRMLYCSHHNKCQTLINMKHSFCWNKHVASNHVTLTLKSS